LEDRRLLSVADFDLSNQAPIEAANLGSNDMSTIFWQGEQRAVNPGHWIVGMDGLPGIASLQQTIGAQLLQQHASGPAMKLLRSLGGRGSLLIETAPTVSYTDVRTSLSGLPGFRYVEPDFLITVDSTIPNDPSFSTLYGLNNTGQSAGTLDADIDAPEAWDLTIGSRSVVVGVIDSGVDYNHPDLAANIWTNPGEIAGDGKDNDGNGYIDDVHGYDFANNDGDPFDDYGHGTHVAGTIGAIGNNNLGVAGVNWLTQIMGLKFLGANGSGATSAAVSALNYATMMEGRGVNIRVTNNSWGGGAFSQAMSDAIAASGAAEMLFVAAAGNAATNIDTTPYYPASYALPNVITVAATDRNDALASFSNYGTATVDLAAPGSSIYSTYLNNSYVSMSGTSMATPHVSGAAALAWSYAPSATYQQVRDAMFDGVDELAGLSDKTITGGRLNVYNTLAAFPSDAGDTLATARVTRMATLVAGDHYILPSAQIGDFTTNDVDIYQITAPAGGGFSAITSQPSPGTAMDTVLRLFDSAGLQVAVNDNSSGLYSRLDYTLVAAGTYYLGVSGAGNANYNPKTSGSGVVGSTGSYRLDVSLDIGNTRETGVTTGLVLGGSFTQASTSLGDGSLGSSDIDFYQFVAPANSNLKAVTSQPVDGRPMNTFLRIFNSTGMELAASTDSSGYARLDYYPFTAAGTYYVAVSGVNGSTGDYRLDLSLDHGDTLGTATVTSLVGTGNFSQPLARIGDGHFDGKDVDLYQFTAVANSVFTATTFQPTGGVAMDTVLRLFDNAGNPLATENNTPLYSRLSYVFTAEGTYYVGVSGAPNNDYDPNSDGSGTTSSAISTGDYRLNLTVAPLAVGQLELSTLLATNSDGSQGFAVSGIVNGGGLGGPRKYQPVGDINEDGIDDFLLSAPTTLANATAPAQAYLIFGKPGGFDTGLDLSALTPSTGYVLNGVKAGDTLGYAGGGAGDVNGDTIPDLVLGAPYADPVDPDDPQLTIANAGQVYVLFGGAYKLLALDNADGPEDGRINLDSTTLNGARGFTINGTKANAYTGMAIDAAGDVNGDHVDDLVIGASGSDTATAYVVFGSKTGFSSVLALSALNGSNGFSIPQLVTYDYVGTSVAGVGDVNDDGKADILLGAYGADPSGRSAAGQAYVIFGQSNFSASFSLASLNGSNGFTINGNAAGDYLGYEVDGAGDVNGDGVEDMLIGAMGLSGPAGAYAGAAYIVFGKSTSFDPTLEISTLTGSNGVALHGAEAGGQAGMRVGGVGDFNKDGYDDVLINAQYADPNGVLNAGQSYLVYGGKSFGASFNLSSLLAAKGGDAANGLVFNGFATNDYAASVAGLGDINNDGWDDLRVGATSADPNGLTNAGEAYIVYGKPSPPRIRVMSANGLITNESGGTAVFHVVLTTQPEYSITIPVLGSTDLSEGTVTASSLLFTPANWQTPQPVVITGVNDNFGDGDKPYTIVLGTTVSADPIYNGIDLVDVSVTNIDNDLFTSTFTKIDNAAIPDRGTYTSSLAIAPTGRILDLNVRVNITHGWNQDLDVFLIAPDGTRTELFTDVGGMSANFTNTILDDEATTSITAGSAPFTGTYLPEGNLTSLEGKSVNGTWKLEVKDDERLITGTLIDWSITTRYTTASSSGPQAVVTPTSGLVTTEGGGTASFTVKLDNKPTANVTIPVSSGDTSEGTVSTTSLVFTPTDWSTAQTVTVTGMDDSVLDGNVSYTIVLGPATSSDLDFQGLNPTDVSVTNTDNDMVTKFYVVNDGSPDRTYEYGASGTAGENYPLNSGNTAPRGAASTIAGDKTWVVDANRQVYVYDNSGTLLGSWTAGTLSTKAVVEGIATNGTDVWIVDAYSDKVYKYAGAATRLSGIPNATSSFSLNIANKSPKDIVANGTSLWVVNDSTTDKVFKYSVTGTLQGSWTINAGGGSPTGLTLDPSSVNHLWIVDSATDRVYQYDGAAGRTSDTQSPSTSFLLASGNTNPQGIADPPAPSSELVLDTLTVDSNDFSNSDFAAYSTDLLTTASPGSQTAHRMFNPQRSALTSRHVDQFMSRLEIGEDTGRSTTKTAWETAFRTRRGIAQRTDMSLDPWSDDLSAAVDALANDLAAMGSIPHRT
jgi:subtilisin family serine protease/subtilisin-like proprotein convertase family protein